MPEHGARATVQIVESDPGVLELEEHFAVQKTTTLTHPQTVANSGVLKNCNEFHPTRQRLSRHGWTAAKACLNKQCTAIADVSMSACLVMVKPRRAPFEKSSMTSVAPSNPGNSQPVPNIFQECNLWVIKMQRY